ncbi:UDP-GalNAc:beta-1,3-N-acetylgalactosaminyltransferase 1-like isoform X2 [Saccostrea cucullata]|uniref:UDP-GalNAc:beta-1, 3-N-acetylgalactosaminyltransferase 1-like isoform X2 n=1 Tax=Saccostrea cuccullata TaxID=36930 RepID=UPI002ED43DAD
MRRRWKYALCRLPVILSLSAPPFLVFIFTLLFNQQPEVQIILEKKEITKAPQLLQNYTNNPYNISHPYNVNFEELLVLKESGQSIPLKPLNRHPYKYILNPSNICQEPPPQNNSLFVLILIKSAPDNFHLRQTLRMSMEKNPIEKGYVRIVFLMGTSKKELNKNTMVENAMYGDLVQQDFVDSYKNLTIKTVMGYNWAVEYCPNATHILYKDDDFHFNVKNLLKFLGSHEHPQSLLVGYRVDKAPVMRHPASPHFVRKEDYPNRIYPPYLAGGAYVVSMDVAQRFVIAFPYVKYITVDDSYIGIVAMKLNILPQMNNVLFSFKDCKDLDSKVIACRGYTSHKEIFSAWKTFVKQFLAKFYI